MKLNVLLFSDNTWIACYDNQIDDAIAAHHWHSDIQRQVKILDAVKGEDRELETYEEWRQRVNPAMKSDKRRSAGQIIMEALISAYDKQIDEEEDDYDPYIVGGGKSFMDFY